MKEIRLDHPARCFALASMNSRILVSTRDILPRGALIQVGMPQGLSYGGKEVRAVPFRNGALSGFLVLKGPSHPDGPFCCENESLPI